MLSCWKSKSPKNEEQQPLLTTENDAVTLRLGAKNYPDLETVDTSHINNSFSYRLSSSIKSATAYITILCYIVFYSSIFLGTSFAYALILPKFLMLLYKPDNTDDDVSELFTNIYWCSLIIALIAAAKETSLYSRFFCSYTNTNNPNMDAWLTKHCPNAWKYFGKGASVIKTLLGASSFGSAIAHAVDAATPIDANTKRIIASTLAGVGAAAQFPATQFFYQEHTDERFNSKKILMASVAISLTSVTNYLVSVLKKLVSTQSHLSAQEQEDGYIALAIFALFAVYYYVRMYYEGQVKKYYDIDPTVKSCFGQLELIVRQAYNQSTNPQTRKYLDPCIKTFAHAQRILCIGGVVSTGLLYCMWTAWQTSAIELGWLDSNHDKPYPSINVFDLSMLLGFGLTAVVIRFMRFDEATNRMTHNKPLLETQLLR